MSKSMKVIFTFSLVLNVLLLGIICGHTYHVKRGGHPSSWKELRGQITPEAIGLIKEAFENKRPEVIAVFKEARHKKKALVDVFSAEEFDPVAYDAAARGLQQLGVKISDYKLETFKDLGSKLSQPDREALAHKFASTVLGKHGRKGRWKDRSDRDGKQN